jgi:hypothetical protein
LLLLLVQFVQDMCLYRSAFLSQLSNSSVPDC